MATRFQSAAKRGYWLGILFSTGFDFLIAFVIALFFSDTAGQALVIGFLILVAVNVFQLLYALLGVAKTSILFFLFEKKARVAATVDQMIAVKMPKPMQVYLDAEEYLAEVVKKSDAGSDAKLFAGATIGSLETLRSTNHAFLTICLSLVLEDAIKRYGRKVGFVWDDGTDVASKDVFDDD